MSNKWIWGTSLCQSSWDNSSECYWRWLQPELWSQQLLSISAAHSKAMASSRCQSIAGKQQTGCISLPPLTIRTDRRMDTRPLYRHLLHIVWPSSTMRLKRTVIQLNLCCIITVVNYNISRNQSLVSSDIKNSHCNVTILPAQNTRQNLQHYKMKSYALHYHQTCDSRTADNASHVWWRNQKWQIPSVLRLPGEVLLDIGLRPLQTGQIS